MIRARINRKETYRIEFDLFSQKYITRTNQSNHQKKKMGGSQPKPKPIDPRDQIEDAILDLRMTAKSFEHSANRAEREQKKEIERAKMVINR